jgi:hypothetical protein
MFDLQTNRFLFALVSYLLLMLLNHAATAMLTSRLKGQSHEKVSEVRECGVNLGHN